MRELWEEITSTLYEISLLEKCVLALSLVFLLIGIVLALISAKNAIAAHATFVKDASPLAYKSACTPPKVRGAKRIITSTPKEKYCRLK